MFTDKYLYLLNSLVLLQCFFSPFESCCISSLKTIVRSLTIIICFLSIIYLFITKKIKITHDAKIFFALFGIPIIVSYVFGGSNVVFFEPNNLVYNNYLSDSFGRITNYISLFCFFGFLSFFSEKEFISNPNQQKSNVINYYWLGCCVSVFFCVWQFVSLYLHLVPFPFVTRDFFHSVGKLGYLLPGRLTGIANEPSYIIPILFDFILLSSLLYNGKKSFILKGIGLFCLLFTFSGSAAFELLLFIIAIYLIISFKLLKQLEKSKLLIWLTLTSIIMFCIVLFFQGNDYFKLFTLRLTNVSQSGRYRDFVLPFVELHKSGFINLLFGHGPKGYILLQQKFNSSVTSNSLYGDLIWEQGLIGFFTLFIFIFYLTKDCPLNNKYGKLLYVFVFHFLILSTYRSDFASLRFYIYLVILFELKRLAKLNLNKKS